MRQPLDSQFGRRAIAAKLELTSGALRKILKCPPTWRVAGLIAFVADVEPAAVPSDAWPSVCPTCGRCG